jgi:hypothetical protein
VHFMSPILSGEKCTSTAHDKVLAGSLFKRSGGGESKISGDKSGEKKAKTRRRNR